MVQSCKVLALQPEQSGGVGSIPDMVLSLERHDKEVTDSISA